MKPLFRPAPSRTRLAAPPVLLPGLSLSVVLLLAARPCAAQGGPTLATEDTMHTDISTVLVKAPRVTLDEILDRVARGEARRDSLLRDQSFTATLRVVKNTAGKGKPELFAETVAKVYKKKPDMLRTVELRHYVAIPDKD